MIPQNYPRLLSTKRTKWYTLTRRISKYIHRDISSKVLRQNFLDYFISKNEHAFIKSSPVVPFCDPTVPFVNAGMNQFKGIFLGNQSPHFTTVANSQKCIRVGGKHNDLSIVGKDGFHHTFFEMMGNWSFGDYFKKEACYMAWELLTQVYKIPPSRLYITYFGGDEALGLSSDVETQEIWKSLGVLEDRIIPFGLKDNFWEMGLTGPCGPCTEIHFDHLGTVNRSQFVNKDLHDLTEIWNLVFVQYNRLPDGSISTLPKKHIDTGLGLERLACAMQGKLSTYDTDLFDYLLNAIQKNCSNVPKYSGKFGEHDWNDVDTSYRTLADHMRMITVSLADGVIPEQNQKLRRIMRKCFILAEKIFHKEQGLIRELSNYVVENLGDVYPELERNITQIHQIIDFEEEIYNSVRKSAEKEWKKLTSKTKYSQNVDLIEITPGFIGAFKELCNSKPKEIDGELAFKLYDTHGLDADCIEQISQLLKIDFNPDVLMQKMDEIKIKSKESRQISGGDLFSCLQLNDLQKTDDSDKYLYSRSGTGYTFPVTTCKVLQVIDNGETVPEAKKGISCSLILDKTNHYSEAGGQVSDQGTISFKNNAIFHVEYVSNIDNYVIHKGYLDGDNIQVGSEGLISINEDFRLSNMRNHTCTHLLNAALKKVKKATCQKSSRVTNLYLNLDVAIFGSKLNTEDIVKVEDIINQLIKNKVDVRVDSTDSQGLYSYDHITLIPGEIYPQDNIRVIEVENGEFISREPCCGTHILNTEDIEDFCIISVKSLRRSTASLHAVSGERANLARKNAAELQEDINVFKKSVEEYLDKPDILDIGILSLKKRLNFEVTDNSILPFVFKQKTLEELDEISRYIKVKSDDNLRNFVDMEMQDALKSKTEVTKSNKKYLVHYIRSSMMLESVPLQRATNLCNDMPVIVIAYSNSMVKARCSVPREFQNENFNAEKWLKETIASVFKSKIAAPRGHDGASVCNMKATKIHVQDWHNLLSKSLEDARNYINRRL